MIDTVICIMMLSVHKSQLSSFYGQSSAFWGGGGFGPDHPPRLCPLEPAQWLEHRSLAGGLSLIYT